ITDPEGDERTLAMDDAGRVTGQEWLPYVSSYNYAPSGMINRVTLGTDSEASVYQIQPLAAVGLDGVAYDLDYTFAGVKAPAPYDGAQPRITRYQFDPQGRILAEKRPDGVTLTWKRDSHHNVE